MNMKIIISTIYTYLLLLYYTSQQCDAYKIFAVFPTMAKSHFIIGHALMKGLADAGHEVTVLSSFPQKIPIKNYHDITFEAIKFEEISDKIKKPMDILKLNIFEMLKTQTKVGLTITNKTLSNEITQKLINSGVKFDVVIVESFLNEAMLGFGWAFGAPIVSVSTFGASEMTTDMVGSPSPLSYVPSVMLSFTDHMTFFQRVGNTLMAILGLWLRTSYWHQQTELYDKLFPNPKPPLDEVHRNVSLVLLNSHFSINYPRPYVPNMIEVGGIHVDPIIRPLPSDLKIVLDTASDTGVIYFSMGSNINSTDLPIEKRNALLKTFSKLKQKVLWKWEDETLPNKPSNVLISKWFPQNDILAHPNIRLFVTHGGLLGSTEAIYHGVPLIGIPIFGDQHMNMAKAVQSGYGLTVPYDDLTEETLTAAIDEMLTNNKYTQKVKIMSNRFRDRLAHPLQTAIYWVEYIARHNGAPQLHSAGQDLHWIAYHSLDVFGFLLLIILLCIYLVKKILLRIFCRSKRRTQKEKKYN